MGPEKRGLVMVPPDASTPTMSLRLGVLSRSTSTESSVSSPSWGCRTRRRTSETSTSRKGSSPLPPPPPPRETGPLASTMRPSRSSKRRSTSAPSTLTRESWTRPRMRSCGEGATMRASTRARTAAPARPTETRSTRTAKSQNEKLTSPIWTSRPVAALTSRWMRVATCAANHRVCSTNAAVATSMRKATESAPKRRRRGVRAVVVTSLTGCDGAGR